MKKYFVAIIVIVVVAVAFIWGPKAVEIGKTGGVPNFVKELCGSKDASYQIKRCGTYYNATQTNTADSPSDLYDQSGKIVAQCGGMPNFNGEYNDSPICDPALSKCQQTDLCGGNK